MSKGARLRAERARSRDPLRTPWQFPRPGERIEVAFVPGLTIDDDEAVRQMQKRTHDGLIELLGPRRRSGVSWRHVHGRAECERVLGLMYEDNPQKWADVRAHYFPFLAEHADAAVMVVAECKAVR